MKLRTSFVQDIFKIKSPLDFEPLALELFRYQYHNVLVYKRFCDILGRNPERINSLNDIPFLPVDFFRLHRISDQKSRASLVFSSSGTTGSATSFHEVPFPEIYETSFSKGFEYFYGDIGSYCVLALLPSYLERKGSSLVYMANKLIKDSGHSQSGFYLYDFEKLYHQLQVLKSKKQKTLLLGVTYALLDLAAQYPIDFPEMIIMETGGMKGRRKEMIREEVHDRLKNAFQVTSVHSEYGMTELLSQAYSSGEGIYSCPPWMRVLIREMNDPLCLAGKNQSGGINVIDLANVHSCAFVAIQDIGRLNDENHFEVLGRFDQAQIRGCNLMVV
jgi:phenylacetate-coenzyme A ligase PaaK-like adenylate-forming protein